MTGSGEIRNGFAHVHVVMGIEGDRAIAGHLHEAMIGTHFAHVYVNPPPDRPRVRCPCRPLAPR